MSDDFMTELPEGCSLGPYRIVRLIGKGGMGAVYEARQAPLDRRVALKTLHPDYASNKGAVARFFNEAKALSRLEHPSIVQVSDFGSAADGTAYLVMEFLRGEPLGHRIRERGARGERMPLVSALEVAIQVADVLLVAHAAGIVHRDIKPDNLMLIPDSVAPGGERVKVLDFGIAKLTHPDDRGAVRTATQAVIGTPSYMSPEQCAGAGGVDERTDVYALGCVLFEMLAGRPPFVAQGGVEIMALHLFQPPPPLQNFAPQAPPPLVDFIHKLLIKDKAQRPTMTQAAEELREMLLRFSDARSVLAERSSMALDPGGALSVGSPPYGSTLGRSLGQYARRPTRRSVLLAFGGVAVLGITLLAEVRGRSSNSTPMLAASPQNSSRQSSEVIASPPGRAKPRSITWRVESEPGGCAVLDANGQRLGITPLVIQREAEPGESRLRVHSDGYADVTLTMSHGRDETQKIVLVHPQAPDGGRGAAKTPRAHKPSRDLREPDRSGSVRKPIGYERE